MECGLTSPPRSDFCSRHGTSSETPSTWQDKFVGFGLMLRTEAVSLDYTYNKHEGILVVAVGR